MKSVHDQLSKTRKPRVHITYDVETEGTKAVKELPFVVGVMGDYSGNNPGTPVKPMKDRKFVQIDGENFNDIMDKMKPGLNIKVDNTLSDTNSEIAVELVFNRLEDFEPEAVVQQVAALRQLLETRNRIRDLMTKADRSDELEKILEQVLTNEGDLNTLAQLTKKEEI